MNDAVDCAHITYSFELKRARKGDTVERFQIFSRDLPGQTEKVNETQQSE
jgi:hypothetical protein